jgi:hypothetical protein
MSDIWVDCELSMASRQGELGITLCVGEEEYGEKKDFGSAVVGVSSESESAGVIVGGAGCDV